MGLTGPTEAGFTRAVIEYANLRGWVCAHFRPGRTKGGGWRTPCQGQAKGWPDLFMVRGRKIVVAELKCGKGAPTVDQSRWLDLLRGAGMDVYVWRETDWAQIEETLA